MLRDFEKAKVRMLTDEQAFSEQARKRRDAGETVRKYRKMGYATRGLHQTELRYSIRRAIYLAIERIKYYEKMKVGAIYLNKDELLQPGNRSCLNHAIQKDILSKKHDVKVYRDGRLYVDTLNYFSSQNVMDYPISFRTGTFTFGLW